MNDALDWEDLRLFYKVASLGSLAAASSHTGISSPTIGRRMHDLERVLQRELFDPPPNGLCVGYRTDGSCSIVC
jgi:DNA-binding transcriptional LysR family regulator